MKQAFYSLYNLSVPGSQTCMYKRGSKTRLGAQICVPFNKHFLNSNLENIFFFQRPFMSVRVARAAAQDWAVTHHGLRPPPTFRLVKTSSGSIQDSETIRKWNLIISTYKINLNPFQVHCSLLFVNKTIVIKCGKGLSIKGVRTQGSCPVRIFCEHGGKGVFRWGRPHFFM